MKKYLSFITSAGTEYISTDSIIYVELSAATSIVLHTIAQDVTLTGTGFTQVFVDEIYEALFKAAETSWTDVVSEVKIPVGAAVTSIAVA